MEDDNSVEVKGEHFGINKTVMGRFLTIRQIRDFIKIRSERSFTKEGKPVYKGIKGTRAELVNMAILVFHKTHLEPCLRED